VAANASSAGAPRARADADDGPARVIAPAPATASAISRALTEYASSPAPAASTRNGTVGSPGINPSTASSTAATAIAFG
jgi:hypothetical protein